MTAFWEPLICNAAVSCFNRTGKVPSFVLAEGDLIELCAEVSSLGPEQIRGSIAKGRGYVAIRCMVRCEALGTAIVVDEWRTT